MTKKEARLYSLSYRKKIKNVDVISEKIVNEIIQSGIINTYNNIGIYFPIGNEIDITSLLAYYKDKNFYLPITRNDISFVSYKFGDTLVDGPFSTREPIGTIIDRDTIECFLIPCVGISRNNQRIGYGKGYYDRYLKDYTGLKIGVCYKQSNDLDVDCSDFDIYLDYKFLG